MVWYVLEGLLDWDKGTVGWEESWGEELFEGDG